jgi:parvulin-like peptidyl-prolyl isomerase
MNRQQLIPLTLLALLLTAPLSLMAQETPAAASAEESISANDGPTILLRAPLLSEDYAKVPIAEVNGENILLEQVTQSLATVHEGMKEGQAAKKPDLAGILNRLITTRLIIQEARNIELDKQEEFIGISKVFSDRQLRESLRKDHLKEVKSDPAEVEKRYQQLISEWKLSSGVFTEEKAAKAFRKAALKAKDFNALLTQAVEKKEAEGVFGRFNKRDELHPDIITGLETAKVGFVSDVIPLTKGFLVYRLDEVRTTENEKFKEKAVKDVEVVTQVKALEELRESLVKKHLKLNQKIIKSLDFEAKEPGIDAYISDTRVIAEIADEKPITVGDLAKAVKDKFFHGVEQAVKDKKTSKVNKMKDDLLFELTSRRAFDKEARLRKLDQTDDFRETVTEYEDSVLFGTFVEKVIKPDIKMSDEELNAYYEANKSAYTYPEMLKLDGIGFTSQAAAEAGIGKLRQGMDFKWFKENAEGRIETEAKNHLHFSTSPVLTSTLDEGMRKALVGVEPDEYRLYAAPGDIHYVLRVIDILPSGVQSYSEVEPEVLKGVFFNKLNNALDDWGKKLREASDVKVYVQFDK